MLCAHNCIFLPISLLSLSIFGSKAFDLTGTFLSSAVPSMIIVHTHLHYSAHGKAEVLHNFLLGTVLAFYFVSSTSFTK